MIKELFKGSLAVAAVAALSNFAAPAHAAGLLPPEPEPVYVAPSAAFNCYVRADVGYSWDIDGFDGDYNGATTGNDIDDGYFLETGIGCGNPSLRGFRAEVVFGYRDERDIVAVPPQPPVPNDPLFTDVETYTLMANFYYDFGNFSGFIPYVGAGIGFAYHQMGDVVCAPEVPGFCNPAAVQAGDEDLHFAWSLMAGVGYEVSDRVIVDVGYRYIDLGDVSSERADSFFFVNPFFNVDDLRNHEIKAGVRYRFGFPGH